MRTFERTHPWISFSKGSLHDAPPKLWILLGEAVARCEQIARAPLKPMVAENLHQIYLAKGALATTAIEGNTLSEQEVLRIVKGDFQAPPSKAYLQREVENILIACKQILTRVAAGEPWHVTTNQIAELNRQVLDGLELEDGVKPGELRTYKVAVGDRYRGAPPEDLPYLLGQLCDWLRGADFEGEEVATIYGILRAVISHLYLAWIHPFGDGNGRTARLLEFQILVNSGVPSPAAHLLSNHYNATRSDYYAQLDRASKSNGNIIPFVMYAVQGFVDGLHEQLEHITHQQMDLAWRDYVREKIHDTGRPSDRRKRDLVLDLSYQTAPVPRAELSRITPGVAAAYAGKTPKALARDINELLKLELIRHEQEGFVANRDRMTMFLPLRHPLNAIVEEPKGTKTS